MQCFTTEMLSHIEQQQLCYCTTAIFQIHDTAHMLLQTCQSQLYSEAFHQTNDDCLSDASTEKNVQPSKAAINAMRRVNSKPSQAAIDAMKRVGAFPLAA